jgi:hypothetical protein
MENRTIRMRLEMRCRKETWRRYEKLVDVVDSFSRNHSSIIANM